MQRDWGGLFQLNAESCWSQHVEQAEIHLASDHSDSTLTDLQAWAECWTTKEQFWLVSQSHRGKQKSKSELSKPQTNLNDESLYWIVSSPTLAMTWAATTDWND